MDEVNSEQTSAQQQEQPVQDKVAVSKDIFARCMKCRDKKIVGTPLAKKLRNGMYHVTGTCLTCGTKMSCFSKEI